METVRNRNFMNESVILDGNAFFNCNFHSCQLVFSGGKTQLKNCRASECALTFNGAAANTMDFLHALGLIKPENLVVPENIN